METETEPLQGLVRSVQGILMLVKLDKSGRGQVKKIKKQLNLCGLLDCLLAQSKRLIGAEHLTTEAMDLLAQLVKMAVSFTRSRSSVRRIHEVRAQA